MRSKFRINQNNISVIATIALFIILFMAGSMLFTGFFSAQVFYNLFIDNAYLIIIATGEALVIITGGIDLSVGAMVAFVSMIAADLLTKGFNPVLVIILILIIGTTFGLVQGVLIQIFKLHPWIVTLAGMFFARGFCYLISIQSIVITDKLFSSLSMFRINLVGGSITISVVVALITVAALMYVAKYTRFGRNIYALGGGEQSATLMGLPVAKTKILVYTLSGFCSSLGGLLFTIYTLSGYALHCNGMEMDAIAACVIGGILLTGGFGHIIGPLFGVLSAGVIQTLIMFQGTLISWWTRIAVGFLLFMFIVLQRVIVIRSEKRKSIVKSPKAIKETISG